MTIRFLSVCSGIEAASVAWHSLGWQCAGLSEIEAFPRAVLEHRQGAQAVDWDHRHTPQSNSLPLFGDFTQIESYHVGSIDLLVGGTPCQSFSIAGLRGGLADDRGNLALEFLRLADRTRPRWLVWENVPGVLSSNGGRDFGSILGGMVELGYGFAYRVLDAQFFGVPQRRRRVFVVGHLGDWRSAAAVLFERHCLSGHSAPRREKGKIAPTVPSRSSAGGGLGTDFDCDGGLIEQRWPADIAPTLNAAFGSKMGLEDQHIRGGAGCSSLPDVAMCLNAGAMGRRDAETETLIPTTGAGFDDALGVERSLRGEGFDASEDGTGRGTPLVPVAYGMATQQEPKWAEELCPTLQVPSKSGGGQPHCVAFAQNTGDEVRMVGGDGQIVGALAAESGMKQTSYVAFTAKDYGADAMDDCSPTLRAGGFTGSHANGGVMPAVAFAIQERAVSENLENGPQGKGYQEGVAYTLEARNKVQATAFALRGRAGGAMPEVEGDQVGALRAASGGSSRSYVASSAVRRLTPRECERLQGFPEVQKSYTSLVCQNLSDQQKDCALVALQCLKSPSNVWNAGVSGWTPSAETVEYHSSTSHPDRAPLVAADALIDLELQEVQLHSAGKLFSLASNAGAKSEFPLPTGIASFARFAALLTHAWDLTTCDGRAGSQLSTKPSSHLLNGRSIAISYGRETSEHVSDVATAIEMANRLSTSTTLPSGLDTETLHSILTTLSCCVVRAIAGFIPEKTKLANCYAVRLTTSQGYTAIPWRGKGADQCPDGPRYKALGNSMAVPCMTWIGERIAAVEAIINKDEAA